MELDGKILDRGNSMRKKNIYSLLFRLWCFINLLGGVLAIVFYLLTEILWALVVGCIIIILFTYLLTSKRINKLFK